MQTKQHPMATLAVGASNVMDGKHAALDHTKRIATLDDKMVGSTLANEIIAAAKMDSNIWRTFAWRIIGLNMEARTALMNAIKVDKAAMTKASIEFGMDDKVAAKRTNSFATRISEMRAFANAFNSGATITGMMEFINRTLPPAKRVSDETEVRVYAGYVPMLEYAKTFGKSKAGRPSKTWTEKLIKFLEDNTPAEDNAAEMALHVAIVKMVNTTDRSASTAPF